MNDAMGIIPTKASIRDYASMYCNARVVEIVDSFDTIRTRHICAGSKEIIILNKSYIPVPTTKGMLNIEVFYCQRCGKLIINRSTME